MPQQVLWFVNGIVGDGAHHCNEGVVQNVVNVPGG
jgi:hypothetical protein